MGVCVWWPYHGNCSCSREKTFWKQAQSSYTLESCTRSLKVIPKKDTFSFLTIRSFIARRYADRREGSTSTGVGPIAGVPTGPGRAHSWGAHWSW